jgi:hypothetical protein
MRKLLINTLLTNERAHRSHGWGAIECRPGRDLGNHRSHGLRPAIPATS